MNYDELVALAHRHSPRVLGVVVGPATFEEIKRLVDESDSNPLNRMIVRRSEFVPEGFVVGVDHKGDVVKVWGPE